MREVELPVRSGGAYLYAQSQLWYRTSGVARGVRRRAVVGILINPRLSAAVLEFTPVDERVAPYAYGWWGGKL